MHALRSAIAVISLTTFCLSAAPQSRLPAVARQAGEANYIHRSVKAITDVMVHDVFSPPVASRIYAYLSVAGYEVARQADTSYPSLAGQLHGLTNIPAPDALQPLSYSLATVQAILLVGKALVISEERVGQFREAILKEFKAAGMPENVFRNSLAYGEKVAGIVLAWAAKDNYKQTRSLPKYDPDNDSDSWKPTPPAYMKAVEPHWSGLRTFLLDSATQFKPLPPSVFSVDTASAFYKEAWEVYSTVAHVTPLQREIANFWDCNPFKMNVSGHVMFATKKISPGGHWINITALTCQKIQADYIRSAQAYACVSLVIADAFISCWDEKYRSKLIRPESYINQYIDGGWMPLLQTPPFPEHTSGHSVVSSSAAVILTDLFGENFAFTDSTENEFGILPRQFTSFQQAAQEAAISRLYGGIHYRRAINTGLDEGARIGRYFIRRLRMSKS